MKKTKVTTRKGSKSKTEKESPEVFVLPPNLLEQLGIHLGNYGSPSESTEGAQVTDSNLIYIENESAVNKLPREKDSGSHVTTSSEISSSIIETAKLMKNSVFLSPTFISNNANIIQGEIEIVGNAEAEGMKVSAGQKGLNNECSPKIAEELFIQKEHLFIPTVESPSSIPTSLSTQESIQCDQMANGNVEMNDVQMQTFLDDHADEAYSSDCSNSNMGCTTKTDLKSNHTKINIISEQIILPSQYYKLKSNYSPKENSLIHVSINTMINSQNNIQNSIHQNDSDLIRNEAGNIVPNEITVVREGDMLGQHFAEEDSNLPMEDNEILQNINKIDLCTVLNEAESEFIITTKKPEDSTQDLKVLKNPHKKDVITIYDVAMDPGIVIPCRIGLDNGSNTTNKTREDFSTNSEMYSKHSANVLKESFKMYNTDSCIDETKDQKVISGTMSNESKAEILTDNTESSVISCTIEAHNESKNTYENKYSHMEVITQIEYITGDRDRDAYQEVFSSQKEFVTPGQNGTEQPSILQNCETNSIIIEKARPTTDNKETNQSVMENQTQSVHNCQRPSQANTNVNKTKSSSDTVQVKPNKQNPVQNTSTGPIFYMRSLKKPVSENNELVEDNGKQQIKHEHSEPNEIKKCNTDSLEGNELKICHKNNASLTQEDKVREIAKYLSEFADMKKRNHFINIHKMAGSKTLSNKKGTIYSKSSIQGVEKPGGSEIKKEERHYPPSKTYRRRGLRRKRVPSYVFKESITSTQSINLTDCSSSNNVCYDMDYMEECLCYDFGRLKSYDDVNSYEHIHFWNSAKTDCTPEIIFSIYSDNTPSVAADNEVINVIEEYPCENSHETPYKLCWNELKLTNENGFEECVLSEESELVQNYLFTTEKNTLACADRENVEKKECNEKLEVEKEAVCQDNKMENANLSQTCESIPNNKIASDEHSSITRQKRKRATVIGDDGAPNNSKRRISKRLSETQDGYIKPQEEQTTTNSVKIYPNNNASLLKTATTPLSESTTLSSEQTCTLSTKTSTICRERPASFHYVIVTEQHQAGSCGPVNESRGKGFDWPSTSLNKASNTSESQTKIPETVVTTHRLYKKEKPNKTIICGVCQNSVEVADWINHISSQHNYLAWKYGEPSLDVEDETAVGEHLYRITKVCGGLTCANCGLTRKYVKAYLSHVRGCTGLNENLSEIKPDVESVDFSVKNEGPFNDSFVKCGVCEESIQDTDWNDHRASRHDYLSWKFGEPPLDVNNEVAVREHLYEITKACGGLTCAKCGLTRKHVKAYLSHIRSCTGLSESQNDSAYDVSLEVIPEVESASLTGNAFGERDTASANIGSIKCGVCQESVEVKGWNHHIASRHNYLAWKLGDAPLDVNDEDKVRNHLYEITKTCGGLTCAECGLTRKYVKAYLSHIRRCDGLNKSQNDSTCNVSSDEVRITALVNGPHSKSEMANEESVKSKCALVKCAVCDECMEEEDWNSHIAARHEYLAWKLGDTALDVDDETAVRDHLYEITKACGGLTCAKCGLTRKYVKAYLSHVKTCNGPDNSRIDSLSNILTDATCGTESVGLANDSICKVKRESTSIEAALVTCAVCEEIVKEIDWYTHIGTRHDYLAWKLDEPSLDVNDESAVRNHLYIITNECKGLTCSKCGLTRKYVKAYLNHFKNCNGLSESQNDISMSTEVSGVDLVESSNSSIKVVNEKQELLVKCAVCPEHVLETNWISHIASQHDYLAWKDGEKCLDVQDEEAVREHLRHIKRQNGGLKCAKCNINMKSVKSYVNHVKSCRITISDLKDSSQNLVLEPRAPENEEQVLTSPEAVSTLVKCGVCGQYSEENDWMQHIAVSHGYMAWKDGQQPLNMNDEKEVRVHLHEIVKEVGLLTCPKCDLPHKTVKSYLHHIKACSANQEDKKSSFKCGVCNEVLLSLEWEKHLSEKHDYLAWKDGDTAVNEDDEEAVHEHLYNLSKQFGSLMCNKCGLRRKYVKPYMEHIKICKNGVIPEAAPEETVDDSDVVDLASGGTCAVCNKEIEAGKWIQHTQKEHNYLAWREGEKPWNLDDFHDLNQYLYVISKRMEGLTCNKCGIVRKYVKTYLTHIKSCDVTVFNLDSSVAEGVGPLNKDEIQCAMCKEQLKRSEWKNHAMTQHYNISWIIGETPIDIKNPYAVERYLKEYKQVHGRLKCNACKASRASFAGFYAHIIVCGKTEEEIDLFRCVCDICNNKYLCIYKNQHAMIHRVQEYTAELKIKKNENNIVQNTEPILSGKRRAAVKARSVIENYSDNMSKHEHACQSCGFGTDFEDELKTHKCEVSNEKDFSADENSATEIGSSDDESGDTDVDSNISNEVNDNLVDDDDDDDEDGDGLLTKRKVRHREPAPVLSKVSRIPFKVEDPMSYLRQGDEDFCNTYLTDEVLFPQWQCQLQAVLESEMTRYLPPLEQSCKVKYDSGWKTMNRFEANKDDTGTSIFVGASIVCIAWAPLRRSDIRDGSTNFLAVACHSGADCPRYQGDETPKHENLIQIWNFSKFERLPQVALGIAHDFGTVWSMDWCPSGARDDLPDGDGATRRLGLLAVACSSGSAYIFAVPYPSTEVKDTQIVHKIKPVAELRMTMSSERKLYQATSVSWSKQKGHTLVLVGYADGSTAYYDLHSTSPLLLTVENDVQVFHPYNDERPHNTCITGTDLYPVPGDAAGCGAGVWTAPTGAELAARAGAGTPGRARLPTASLAVEFAPHACCAVLGGDDAIMHTAISELAWVPPGRRLGGIRTTAGCGRCGRIVASTPPILRLMRPHPAYWDAKKQVVGLLEMTHLAKKRKKQVNDELGMIVEPLTYEDAITKYGITFKTIRRSDKVMQHKCSAKPKAHCPERFPLADVKSMAFCPSRRYHEKLALATHSGLLFLTTIN